MITLETTGTFRGKAGTATAITYTISGDEVSAGVDAFKTLAQGQLGTGVSTLYTVPGSTATLIKKIHLANTTGSNVTGITFYINGTAATNQIIQLTIPANGSASYDDDGWSVYDSAGLLQFTGSTGPSGTASVGTTTTGAPGTSANVTNSGTPSAGIFDFTIPAGAVWRTGSGAPSNGTGVDGDFYLRSSNGDVYLRSSGTYSVVANLTGPAGPTGPVASVTNVDGTITITGTGSNPIVSRAIISGDVSIPGTSNTATLATVNSNVGTYGDSSHASVVTVNGKGLVTAAGIALITPASIGSPSGSGTSTGTNTGDQVTSNSDGTIGVTNGATNPVLTRPAITGDVSISVGSNSATLTAIGSAIGPIGSSSAVPVVTIDTKGRVTALTSASLGSAAAKNVGNTVLDPGTGKLEFAIPTLGLVTGTNRTYLSTERGYTVRRSNSGSAMSDTLPLLTNTTADIGYTIHIYNQDTVVAAVLTMNASGGALFLSGTGATSATSPINYGSRQAFIWDGTQWILFAGTANLLRRSGTIVANNFPKFVDTAGNATVDSGFSGASFPPVARAINTTAPVTGGGDLSADRTIAVSDATFTTRGTMTAAEKISANSQDGRTSSGTNPRVFRPGDYMVGNTYDPTGSSDSTSSFSAMMTAARAWNDRYVIEIPPGVWKMAPGTLSNFGTNNTSVTLRGPGRGNCILLPTAAGDFIILNRNTTGGDSVTICGFTIYNTSGTVYTSGAGILTNGADGVDISEVAFIDLYRDIQISGQPYTMTTNGTTSVTSISPAISAADTGQVVSGPGIVPGSTITFATSSTGTLSVAATTSATTTRFLNNSIKASMQKIVSFNSNAGASNTSVGFYVNNGQAGDTYIGPDVVMSDGGGTTRRRANIELVETGHYEIIQANLTGSQYGILIDPAANQSVAFGFHTNVLCDSNVINGMLIDTLATTASVKNIKSVNSWYSGTVNGGAPYNIGAAGVKTQATAAGTLNGITHTTDRFLNNRTHGYEHAAGTDFRWSDCDMKGNSQTGSASADGLNVAANVGNWSINGGKFGGNDASPTSGNQRYGINVAAGTGDNIKISPDSLNGNVTGPLSFGATGISNFINGCPGLASPYARTASSATVTTVITLSNVLIPKNSVRLGTTFRLRARVQQIGTAGIVTFTVRLGAATDAVGAAGTNAIVFTAASAVGVTLDWLSVDFDFVVDTLGGSGRLSGHGYGVRGNAVYPAAGTRAAALGFQTFDTTADRYLTLAMASAGGGAVCHVSTIEIVNY